MTCTNSGSAETLNTDTQVTSDSESGGSEVASRKLWTNSRAKAERLCKYYEHVTYGLGFRPIYEEEPLWFGTLVHKGLEVWWETGGDLIAASNAMGETGDPDRKVMFVVAHELLAAYHDRWIGEMHKFELVSVEYQFRTRLRNPATGRPSLTWDFGGKMDVVVRSKKTGKLWVIEHKTCSEEIGHEATNYALRLLMDSQTSQYWTAAEEKYGEPVEGVLFDVLRKPGIRPSKDVNSAKRKTRKVPLDDSLLRDETDEEMAARVKRVTKATKRKRLNAEDPELPITREETTEETFARIPVEPESKEAFIERLRLEFKREDRVTFWRHPVFRDPESLRIFQADTWSAAQMSHERELNNVHPRNPDQCMHYGRPCQLFEHCTAHTDLANDPRWEKLDWVYPELDEEELS